MSTESYITINKGEEKGVPMPSTNNSKDAASESYQMEASGKGHLQVNYDGAIFEQQGKAGLDVVIQNSNGEVMASMSLLVQLPSTVA